ncbi:hypothetical protein Misp06_00652 [Microbulbifer sp. NBRC 101763]|uniref:hypothetical protein n=1 Tax=unclassified Microbulbifer TaxID=2619833 RepID=UPI0012FCEDFF|nr:hypothetical protein [Microbulbifer sp. MLAF003]WHI49530.1 hypothetical protein P3339_13735 [Microbulbifer sp. MLAF003]
MRFKPIVLCSFIEGTLTNHEKQKLEFTINLAYQDHMNPRVAPRVVWMEVPVNQAFMEGKQSSAATFMAPLPDGTTNTLRHSFLYRLLDQWCSVTGRDTYEVVITAPDHSLSKEFLSTNRKRMSPLRQIAFIGKTLIRLVKSKSASGQFKTHINL